MTLKELENIIGDIEQFKISYNKYQCPYCKHETTLIGLIQHFQMKHTEKGKILRKKISDGMKKAHIEGRANNWQDSRRKNGIEGSYPEQFFKKVIENEFEDKNYIYQYRVGKYSLDFAWPHKKLYIEIDGKQHLNNIEYDKEREEFLKEKGWLGLRILWCLCFDNPKYYIKQANLFINSGKILLDKFYIQSGNVYKVKDKITLKYRAIEKGSSFEIDGFTFRNRKYFDNYVEKKKILLSSGIDFNSFGCFVKLSKLWNMTSQTTSRYYHKYFYKK